MPEMRACSSRMRSREARASATASLPADEELAKAVGLSGTASEADPILESLEIAAHAMG
jgi:hypothetical protein